MRGVSWSNKEEGGMGDTDGVYPDLTRVFTTNTIFESRDALVKWAKQKGAEVGMVVVICKSDYFQSSRRTPRIYLSCEHHGKYKPRKTSRWKNINCPFMLRGLHYAKNEDRWTLKVLCGHHNHVLSTNMLGPSSQPFLGRRIASKEIASKINTASWENQIKKKMIEKKASKGEEYMEGGQSFPPKLFHDLREDCSTPEVSVLAQKKQKVIDKNIEKYWGKIPQSFKPFVAEIEEIDRDGNCGFRAFAKGLWSDESKWEDVRKGCLEELNEFEEVYKKMFGGCKAIKDLRERMDHFTSPCRQKHWLMMPEVGFLVASRYDVVVVHISELGVSTILPLHSWPPIGDLRMIATEFVDDNHSVFVKLYENALLPKPMTLWGKHKHGCASGWESRLSARMEAYDIISRVDRTESSHVHIIY